MNLGENVFIVDSIPIPICKLAREKQIRICKENYETAPDKGWSAVNKSYYLGYKLHLTTSMRGIFHSMNLTKASVHDVHFLSQLKYTRLNNCTLVGDKGYLSIVLKTLLETGKPMKSSEIKAHAGIDKAGVDKAIQSLEKEKKIALPKVCFYITE